MHHIVVGVFALLVVTQLMPAAAQTARTWHTVIMPVPAIGTWKTTITPVPTLAALTPPQPPAKPLVGQAHQTSGIASYYWQDQMTASGERFNKRAMTAAHKTLPLGTMVRVTHHLSGRTVVVRINDRGPFKPGRVIDLSEAAAEQLQMTGAGLAQVSLEVVR